jgi:2,3-bisphosphoglycerate-independent phosphoglycerate mutase
MSISPRAGLIILDGWGIGPDPMADAIARAETPYFDGLMARYPHATLVTHGLDVGLPEGQMGNSEVGHLNIGAGRVVYQELARINLAIRDGELARNPVLLQALELARQPDRTLHLLGLVSDGGVHAHIDHLLALCDIAAAAAIPRVRIHAFTDGRDTGPQTGKGFIRRLEAHLAPTPGIRLASLVGRYYAMDRDRRWERVRRAYDLLVHGQGQTAPNGVQALEASYAAGLSDEFLEPVCLRDEQGLPLGRIRPGDVVLFFNFRTDRPRQLTEVLTQKAYPAFGMAPLDLHYFTFTRYDERFRNIGVLLDKDDLRDTLGEALSQAGKTQLRLAETEKYPHVTYFFSGGREEPFPGETRHVIPSPKVATYDLQPAMSAPAVTEALLETLESSLPDFFCLNFANTDMVGHTGVMAAAMQAAETVDACLARLVPAALQAGYRLLIIADHGNADCMVQPDGTPHTAHTMNPVPVLYVGPDSARWRVNPGRLADIAPTLLHLLDLPTPGAMTGKMLLQPLLP